MTNRPLVASDFQMLQAALDQDQYDHDSPNAYVADGTDSHVYEDEGGPIAVFRYSMALRICAVWCDNGDLVRNKEAAIKFFDDALTLAKDHHFSEIIFTTQSFSLAKFCTEQLGFEKRGFEYVRNV